MRLKDRNLKDLRFLKHTDTAKGGHLDALTMINSPHGLAPGLCDDLVTLLIALAVCQFTQLWMIIWKAQRFKNHAFYLATCPGSPNINYYNSMWLVPAVEGLTYFLAPKPYMSGCEIRAKIQRTLKEVQIGFLVFQRVIICLLEYLLAAGFVRREGRPVWRHWSL